MIGRSTQETRLGSVWRGIVGFMTALTAGVTLLAWATDGFAVLTSDASRARAVARAPQPIPEVSVRDSRGVIHDVLLDGSNDQSRAVIVDFIFTRCITLCSTLGGIYQQLQRAIVSQGLEDRVRLLTISFDVAHDTPDRLALHARVMGARPDVWSLVTPTTQAGADTLLQTFGVQVIADGAGQWTHNAALHIVTPRGELVRIVSLDDVPSALAAALASADSTL